MHTTNGGHPEPTGGGEPAIEVVVLGISDPSASGEALARAVARSRSAPVHLHLVHAYRDLAQVWLSDQARTAVEPLRQECDARLAEVAAALEMDAGCVEYHARPGGPAAVLATVAREQRADLIAVGAARRRRWTWGSGGVAQEVVRRSPCPVLIVPAGPSSTGVRQAAPLCTL